MIAFIIQTAILFGFLYFIPWFGNIQDEARLAAATVAAVIGSGLLLFLWELVKAPAKMDSDLRRRLRDAHTALKLDADVDAIRNHMIDLCKEGRALRVNGTTEGEQFDDWKRRAVEALRENYFVTFVYEFEFQVSAPNRDRLSQLIQIMEQAAMSFGSKAEQAQQAFYPSRFEPSELQLPEGTGSETPP